VTRYRVTVGFTSHISSKLILALSWFSFLSILSRREAMLPMLRDDEFFDPVRTDDGFKDILGRIDQKQLGI
jgi:hypothetical protein